MRLSASYAARSDIGRHRQTNEDAWLARPPLFAVADGMGGAQAGEVASRVALETLADHAPEIDPLDREAAGETLLRACREANRRVWQLSRKHRSQAGMGTTLTVLALCADGARLAHIGDSRAYLLRDGELTQLSDDHSLVGEMVRSGELPVDDAAGHPLRSILSRALGTEPDPEIDLLDLDLAPGDVLLLCSDGLTGPVPDAQIALLLAEPDPEEAARRLVDAALRAGGPDNVTVVVLRLGEAPPQEVAEGSSESDTRVAVGPQTASGAALLDAETTAGASLTAETTTGAALNAETNAGAAPDTAAGPGGADTGTDEASLEPNGTTWHAAVAQMPEMSGMPPAVGDQPLDANGTTWHAAVAQPPDSQVKEGSSPPWEAAATSEEATALEDSVVPPDGGAVTEESAAVAEESAAVAEESAAPGQYLGGAAAPATGPGDRASAKRLSRRRWLRILVIVAVVLAIVAAGVAVVGQLEWVGVSDDGVVTVNRGLPWEFAGVRLYSEHQRTAVFYADLTPSQRKQVDDHAIGWRGSGERLVLQLNGAGP